MLGWNLDGTWMEPGDSHLSGNLRNVTDVFVYPYVMLDLTKPMLSALVLNFESSSCSKSEFMFGALPVYQFQLQFHSSYPPLTYVQHPSATCIPPGCTESGPRIAIVL